MGSSSLNVAKNPAGLQSCESLPRFYGRIGALLVLAASCTLAIASLPINPYDSSHLLPVDQTHTTPIWPLPSELEAIDSSGNHRVFPYSIIPGGARSAEELQKAVGADPVVAQHYSDFDLKKVHQVALSSPQLLHVSYRIGNSVFWTKRKLPLPKGETMLTDGRTMARTRCGNRVSANPVFPTSPQEPGIQDFADPEFSPEISTPYLAAFSVPPPAIPGGASPGSPGAEFTPGIPFIPLPGGGSVGLPTATPPGGSGGTPPPGGGGNPPPVGVPEPSTITLVLLSLSSAVLLRRRAKAC